MAKTNAQRQAAYRKRHLDNWRSKDSARLNVILPSESKRQLVRLAARYAVTEREMLIKLLADAETSTLKKLSIAEQNAYFDATDQVV